jgi:ribonuclease R
MAKNKHWKKKSKNLSNFNKPQLKKAILDVFYGDPQKTYNYKQLGNLLGVKDPETRKLINVVLDELAENENLEQVQRGKFKLKSRGGDVCGRVDMQPQGFAYVNSEEVDQPVLVSQRNLNHAMEGDKVRVSLYARRKKHQLEGEVTEIIERAKSTFVGTVERSKKLCLFNPGWQSRLRPVYS